MVPQAPKTWWRVKVAAGALLIALLVVHFVFGGQLSALSLPRWLGQSLVLLGASITLFHYRLLQHGTGGPVPRLVSQGGLFRWVRHPMYLGDALLYLGLALLIPGFASTIVLLTGWYALYRQADSEDQAMAEYFANDFEQWKSGTGLMLPVLSGRRTVGK